MATNIKDKEIQIQKPAQSLQAFQQKLSTGQVDEPGILKPVLIGFGIVSLVALSFFGLLAYRTRSIEKHETALAELMLAVQGDDTTPVAPPELEKRMRENLPKLEALVKSAPSSCKVTTQGVLDTWRLQLDGKGIVLPAATDPWSRLRLAQRSLALGEAKEVQQMIEPLRKKAGPDEAWSKLYWTTQLELDRMQGHRDQAWKDLAEYKARFKDNADSASLERILNGI